MCTRPIEMEGKTFACRTCDECVATRRHGWVARAMMEKAYHSHSMCVALTYDDSTQENRDAAAMFSYHHIQAFLGRVRAAARVKDPDAIIRFLAAGEQGDRYNRCHWHLIIYSSVDLCTLGTFQGRPKLPNGKRGKVQSLTLRKDMLSVGKEKVRLNWSMWRHGFCTFQEPDEGAMAYVLSYVLKDQFTGEKSEGTMRYAKSENFATGMFRMSKRPAIGERFLYDKLADLDRKGAVLPSLNIKVPGLSGYYHPSGSFRKKLLWGLVALNERLVWATGEPAPQWPALLESCSDNEADLEVLNGKPPEDEEVTAESVARTGRQQSEAGARYHTQRKCGGEIPCEYCCGFYTDETLKAFGVLRVYDQTGGITHKAIAGWAHGERGSKSDQPKLHPLCRQRHSQDVRRAFPASSGGDLFDLGSQ